MLCICPLEDRGREARYVFDMMDVQWYRERLTWDRLQPRESSTRLIDVVRWCKKILYRVLCIDWRLGSCI